jgi:hypothetical protein
MPIKDPNALRLRDLVQPPPPVELPSGKEVACRPFTYRMHEMARVVFEMETGQAQDEKLRELVELCVPDAGDEVQDLTGEQMLAIVAHAQRRLEKVLEYLEARTPPPGNAPAPAAGKKSRRRRSG